MNKLNLFLDFPSFSFTSPGDSCGSLVFRSSLWKEEEGALVGLGDLVESEVSELVDERLKTLLRPCFAGLAEEEDGSGT